MKKGGDVYDALTLETHLSLASLFGYNRIATAIFRSLQRIAGSSASEAAGLTPGGLVYGDAVVVTGERGQHLYHCLRPEVVLRSPVPLSSDAYTRFGMDNATVHNAEVHQCTQNIIRRLLPDLAGKLYNMDYTIYAGRHLTNLIHEQGLNVRHLGMLRVYMDLKTMIENGSNVKRVRGLLLTEMTTRVLKQLFREALRGVADRAAKGRDPAKDSEPGDVRLELLRACLNRVLTKSGAWAIEDAVVRSGQATHPQLRRAPVSEGGDDTMSASELLWGTVIRTHIQLKFGAQMPALTAEEMRPSYDLRHEINPTALASAICAQLGVRLRASAVHKLLASSSPIMARKIRPGAREIRRVHMHDPLLLPRIRVPTLTEVDGKLWKPNERTALEYDAKLAPQSGDSAMQFDTLMVARLGVRQRMEAFTAMLHGKTGSHPVIQSLNAGEDDEEYFAHVYGVNYAYTNIGLLMDSKAHSQTPADLGVWLEEVMQYYAIGRRWSVSEDRGEAHHFDSETDTTLSAVSSAHESISAGDIQQLDPVTKPLVTDAETLHAIDTHPDITGEKVLRARAQCIADAFWPTFDVFRSSPHALLSNAVQKLCPDAPESRAEGFVHPVDTVQLKTCDTTAYAISNISIFAAPADTPSTPASLPEAPTASAGAEHASRSDNLAAASLFVDAMNEAQSATIAELLSDPHAVAWDFILHPGYDYSQLKVGLACLPLRWSYNDLNSPHWLFKVADGAVNNGESAEKRREEVQQQRAHMHEYVKAWTKDDAFKYFRQHLDLPDVVTIVLNTRSRQALVFVNGQDTGVWFTNVIIPGYVDAEGEQTPGMSLNPMVYVQGSTTANVTIANVRGSNYCLDAVGGAYTVSRRDALRQQMRSNRIVGGVNALAVGASMQSHITAALAINGTLHQALTDVKYFVSEDKRMPHVLFDRAVYPAELWELGVSATALRSLNRLHLTQIAFGGNSRHTQDATLQAAEAFVKCGNVKFVMHLLQEVFRYDADPGTRYPQHCVARGYMLLGDLCLQSDSVSRAPDAEKWYARALAVLMIHSQQPLARSFIDDLFAATVGNLHPDRVKHWKKASQLGRNPDARVLDLHPFTMVVLDRLIGVCRMQNRSVHAIPFTVTFLQLWKLHAPSLPSDLTTSVELSGGMLLPSWWHIQHRKHQDPNDLDSSPFPHFGPNGMFQAPWLSHPFEQVFGHRVPFAFEMWREHKQLLKTVDGVYQVDQRARSNDRSSPAIEFAATQRWMSSVRTMVDQGATFDVEAPAVLGVNEHGPLPGHSHASGLTTTELCTQSLSQNADYGGLFYWHEGIELKVQLPLTPGNAASGTQAEVVRDVSNTHALCVTVTTHGRAFVWATRPSTPANLLGIGDSTAHAPPFTPYPLRVLYGKKLTQVSCGRNFVVLLDADGTVFSFGDGDGGALGHGDTAPRNTPRAIRALESIPIARIAAGSKHVLAAAANPSKTVASVYSWGSNEHGCCGVGHKDPVLLPAPVRGFYRVSSGVAGCGAVEEGVPAKVTVLDADECSSIAISEDGILYRFGHFHYVYEQETAHICLPTMVVPQLDTNWMEESPAIDGLSDDSVNNVSRGLHMPHVGRFHLSTTKFVGVPVGDLSVRFRDAAVTRFALYAVSTDGRLYSQGRADLGQTGHATLDRPPHQNLVRVARIGPCNRNDAFEAKFGRNELRFVSVHADTTANGAFAVAAVRNDPSTSSSPVSFTLWHVGDYPKQTSTRQCLELVETLLPGKSSHNTTAAHWSQIPHLLHPNIPLHKISARYNDKCAYAIAAEPHTAAALINDVFTIPETPPAAWLKVTPECALPGESLTVEYFVPHDCHGLKDGIGIRPQDEHYAFASGEPWITQSATGAPYGRVELKAPSAPGAYTVSYFIGMPIAAKTISSGTVQSWVGRLDVNFNVVAAFEAHGKGSSSLEIMPLQRDVILDSGSIALLALLRMISPNTSATSGAVFTLPLSKHDLIVLMPVSTHDTAGVTRGRMMNKPRAAYQSQGFFKGENVTLSHGEKFAAQKNTAWSASDILAKGTTITQQSTSGAAGGSTLESVFFLSDSGPIPPGRYALLYVTPGQAAGKNLLIEKYKAYAIVSRHDFVWVPPVSACLMQREVSLSAALTAQQCPPYCIQATVTAIRIKAGGNSFRSGASVRITVRLSREFGGWSENDVVGWISEAQLQEVERSASNAVATNLNDLLERKGAKKPGVFDKRELYRRMEQVFRCVPKDALINVKSLYDIAMDPASTYVRSDYSSVQSAYSDSKSEVAVDASPQEALLGRHRVSTSIDCPAEPGTYRLVLATPAHIQLPSHLGTALPASNAQCILAITDNVTITAPPAAEPVAHSASISTSAAASDTSEIFLPYPNYEEYELYLDSGTPSALGMATSGPEHDALFQNTMELYRRIFVKNGVPEGMIGTMVTQTGTHMKSSPNIALASVIQTLLTQL